MLRRRGSPAACPDPTTLRGTSSNSSSRTGVVGLSVQTRMIRMMVFRKSRSDMGMSPWKPGEEPRQ